MDTLEYKYFETWLEQYKKAWEESNPELITRLFDQDAIYKESPYTVKIEGIDAIKRYWEKGARDSQTNIRFDYDIITVKGMRGFAKWNAEFDRIGNKIHVELDGILEVVFTKGKKAETFNEWWHRKELKP